MYAYYVPGWVAFATAMLATAALLSGLIFVALSVDRQHTPSHRGRMDRAGMAIAQLFTVIVACALVLVPQPVVALGGELAALGAGAACGLAFLGLRRPGGVETPYRRRAAAQTLLGVTAVALYVPAGLSMVLSAGGGLYWLVPATLLGLGVAATSAWLIVVGIDRP
jgi:modulator of FtsH protease